MSYSTIGSNFFNMLENALQNIAFDFDASQELSNIPLLMYTMASFGRAHTPAPYSTARQGHHCQGRPWGLAGRVRLGSPFNWVTRGKGQPGGPKSLKVMHP